MHTDHFLKIPPFTRALLEMAQKKRTDFDTPGHHSGAFFRLAKEGQLFYDALGPGMFAADISDSSSVIGDPSSHEGVSGEAEELAASTWGSDRTWFVLGGTSASNRIAVSSVVSKGDLVLFDRNSHKSTCQALSETGAIPVYLEAERNESGIIGGLTGRTLSETSLRKKAEALASGAGKKERPFRLACLELSTYDGLLMNVKEILYRIGHLCDYILFDGAWAGYENFLPLLKDSAVLQFPLTSDDPGILITQSVHKQLAGFSMTSQLHKMDSHIRNEKRYVPDDVVQDAFLSHISTSPYYPLFAGLEMNAMLHRRYGPLLWRKALESSIHLKKKILSRCHIIRPFLADGWEHHSTEELISSKNCYAISPKDPWHGFPRIAGLLYMTDPCKTLVTTGSMAGNEPSIPAPLLSAWLEAHGVTPEKSDFYTLLFLNEPGDTKKKNRRLVKLLARAEKSYGENTPIKDFLPTVEAKEGEGVKDFSLRFHGFLLSRHAQLLQQALFSEDHFPQMARTPQEAHENFVKGNRKAVPLSEALGKISLENILPYPPGIVVLAAGEVWSREVLDYFLFLTEYGKEFPSFTPEIVGVHTDEQGEPYVWVMNK